MTRLRGALLCAGIAATTPTTLATSVAAAPASRPVSNPPQNESPVPDYTNECPATLDSSSLCLRVTLGSIDHARALEGLGPMRLPLDFGRLSVGEQLFVAVNSERMARHLTPFTGLTAALNVRAQDAADRANLPDVNSTSEQSDWIGNINNGLDADYQWMYDDGPTTGQRCGQTCWSDRDLLLSDYARNGRTAVMGAALDPTGDTSTGDKGGPSLALIVAGLKSPPSSYSFTWSQALASMSSGSLAPLSRIPTNLSSSGFANPKENVAPVPNYPNSCSSSGIDFSAGCISATLAAINHAHALERVPPMLLPSNFAELSIPEQLFTVIDLERVDRGLRPFEGLTTSLNTTAQKGANTANDPPDPGPAYLQSDGEWAGGNSNGLDADYGWMYDDGYNSGNLDCPHRTSPGCWGHRTGILDNYGTGGNLEMGAAFNPHGDNNKGDVGGPSMAAILVVTYATPGPYLFTWNDVTTNLPTPPATGR